MTLTLELTPSEEARLAAAARARGQDPEAFLRAIIETLPETEDPPLALRKEREERVRAGRGKFASPGRRTVTILDDHAQELAVEERRRKEREALRDAR
jgi:hypothetical protein